MSARSSVLALLVGALLALGLLAGCGGDGESTSADAVIGGDTDPQEILDNTLGGGQQIDSGVLDLALDLSGGSSGNATLSLQGPFQSSGDASLPQLDFTASANGDLAGTSLDFEGGLTLTADGGYVSYGGEDYAFDDATFASLRDAYEQSSDLQSSQESQSSLQQFGVDPATWVTNLTNEGTEDLDGTEVVHVSGTADVGKIVEDLNSVAEQTGQTSQVNAAALGQLESSVEEATIDVYATTADETLRQLNLNISLADPTGGSETFQIALTVGISDPNAEQSITAPEDPKPIADLAAQIPGGASALGGLGGATGATGSAGGTPPAAASGSGGAKSGDAYLKCVSEAKTRGALGKCAALLGG